MAEFNDTKIQALGEAMAASSREISKYVVAGGVGMAVGGVLSGDFGVAGAGLVLAASGGIGFYANRPSGNRPASSKQGNTLKI